MVIYGICLWDARKQITLFFLKVSRKNSLMPPISNIGPDVYVSTVK